MKTILVIDDDEGLRLTVKRLLERDGYRVILSNCGEGGLGIARAEMPALILLDISMPDMDGFEVLRELKESTETSLIPVIMLTASQDADTIKEAIYQYNAEYIVKPFDFEKLKSSISRLTIGPEDE